MLENATETPREGLGSRVVWLFVGGAIGQVAALLLNILLARLLGQAEYGTYRQLLLVHGLMAPIFTIALPASALYFLAREDTAEGRKRFVTQTLLLLGILGAIMGCVMFGGARFFSVYFNNSGLYGYLRIFAVYPAFMLASSFFSPTMIALGRAKISAIYAASTAIIKVGIVLVALLITRDLIIIIIAILLAALVDLALALGLTSRVLGFSTIKEINPSAYLAQLAYCVPLGLAAVVYRWGLSIDQLWISTFFDPSIYAIYAVGAIEVPFIGLLQASVNNVVLPEVARLYEQRDRAAIIKLWQTAIARTALIMFPIFFLLMLTSHDLIILLFSEKYQASVVIFRIYLLMIPLRLITFGLLLRAAGKTKYDFWGSLVALASNAALGFLLVKFIGISGPAWSTVFSLLLLVVYLLMMTSRYLHFRLGDLLPTRIILKYVLMGIITSLGVIIIDVAFLGKLIQEMRLFKLLGTASLFIVFYTLILYKMSPADFRILLNWARFRRTGLLSRKSVNPRE